MLGSGGLLSSFVVVKGPWIEHWPWQIYRIFHFAESLLRTQLKLGKSGLRSVPKLTDVSFLLLFSFRSSDVLTTYTVAILGPASLFPS